MPIKKKYMEPIMLGPKKDVPILLDKERFSKVQLVLTDAATIRAAFAYLR